MRTIKIRNIEKIDVDFCTECGKTLDEFGVTPDEVDYDLLLRNFEKCKSTGKFKGEICSKLFIVNEAFETNESE